MTVKDWLPAGARDTAIERTLKSGEVLFRVGGRTAGLYEVVSGRVRLARVDPAGREIVLYMACAGETVAEASLFSAIYHCDAIATTDALVRLYPRGAVLGAFEHDTKAAQAFMATLARQVMDLRTRLERRNIHSARDRVRHYLMLNVGPDGRTVEIAGTIKDLAAELGLTHEALYRTLSDLAASGEIERAKGKIRLIGPAV